MSRASNQLIPPERAKLIPVTGTADRPDMSRAVEVQFNPTTLKVTMSNTLKENQRRGNSRASQFVDKSSSSLTVELIFDTTCAESRSSSQGSEGADQENSGQRLPDVRNLTKEIAEKFLKPKGSGRRLRAPDRCLFQWGAFEFVGIAESYEETLDFFAPEGCPLRATVSLKLNEDRYQFKQKDAARVRRETPTLSPTGNPNRSGDSGGGAPTGGAPPGSQDTPPVTPPGSGTDQRDWRDTALYNGVESPRLPSASVLAVPKISAGAAVGMSAGLGVKTSFSASVSAKIGSAGSVLQAATEVGAPAFRFGASKSLGTGIQGAFGLSAGAGLTAGSLLSGGAALRVAHEVSDSVAKASVEISSDDGVGFD
jgi:hypothetical protein